MDEQKIFSKQASLIINKVYQFLKVKYFSVRCKSYGLSIVNCGKLSSNDILVDMPLIKKT